jgi:lysozyme family protein
MAEFAPAVEHVLASEGGYVNDPLDRGGETNFGISKRQYPLLNVKNLERRDAIGIYRRDFWDHLQRMDDIASQRAATKFFDIYVNMPPAAAVRILQTALRAIQAGPIVVDGQFGPTTVAAMNAATLNGDDTLVDELKAQLALAYCLDVLRNSAAMHDLLGWLRRAVKG